VTREERTLLDNRNREIVRLRDAINSAAAALKRGDPQDALLQLISATLQASVEEEWAPDR
jgi:hypothetical protein